MYRIKVKDFNNNFIGEFDAFTNLKFGKRLNDYGNCEFSVPITDSKLNSLVALRRNSIWIYRDNDLVWSGEMAMRDASLDDAGSGIVTIYAFDWVEQLKHRYTEAEVIYTQIDAGEIFWDLIDTSQNQTNGDLGITLGTIEETMLRDRKYNTDKIYEMGINLSNVISGFDFEITNDKVFNVRSIIGEDKTNSIVLEHGVNVVTTRITEDFTTPVNRAIILGEAYDMDELQRVDTDDLASQALYRLRERVETAENVSDIDTFIEKGEALIRKYGTQLLKLDLNLLANSPNISQFSLGDLIGIRIINMLYNINEEYRVFEWEVEYTANDEEKLSVVLGRFTI